MNLIPTSQFSAVSRKFDYLIMLQIDHFLGRLLLLIGDRISLSVRPSVPFTHILQGIGVLSPDFRKKSCKVGFLALKSVDHSTVPI